MAADMIERKGVTILAEEWNMLMQAIKEVDASVKGMCVEMSEMKQNVTEMRQDITDMRQDITEMRQDITDIKRELKKTNRRIDEMGEDLSDQIKLVHDEHWETRKDVQKIKKKIGI